jgi:DNA-binding NtrC family response regulator
VRSFLKRELEAEGYQVRLAENGFQVLNLVYERVPLDLLILDPDLPDIDGTSLLEKVHDRIPPLPTIIHTFLTDYPDPREAVQADVFVEKGANSVEEIKRIIENLHAALSAKRR